MANSSDDFSQVISEEVTCPVCLEELKEPKTLNCSHNICRECLELMTRNKKGSIVCPTCRKRTRIPKGGVRYLPTNTAIVRVVEATLARKAKIEMKNSLAEGKPMVELLAKKISDFDKPLKVLNEIHEKADQLVDVIRNQEASLCREVEQLYGIKCETINGEKNDLGKLHSSASRSVQDAETILGQSLSDPTKTINVARSFKEQIEEITALDLSQDTSTLDEDVEFQFNGKANINSIFKDETFGKFTIKKKILNTNLPSSSAADHGFAPISSNVKKAHASSTVSLDNVSDADLYGHGDDASSTQDKGNNIPMDTQEPQDEHELYVDMNGANGNYYEIMYNPDNGLASCNTLPPPPETYQDPGIPLPTYDQATQIPGNDWVMVEDKDSNGLSNTISAMNIDENGHAARSISEVVGVRGVHGPSDIRRLKGASADRMSQTAPYHTAEFYYQTEPQGTSNKTRAIGSPVLKQHYREVKGMGDRSSERSELNGSDNDYKTPPTSFTRGFDNKQPEISALNRPFEIRRDQSTKEKTDLQRRSTSSNSYDKMTSTKTTEYPKERLTRSEPGEFMLKRISEPSVTKTTPAYMTSSYSKGSSTTDPSYLSSKHQSGMITRSQTRATAASESDVASDPLTGTSKTTQQMAERYNKEYCIVCKSKATHYCVMCRKRSCRSCTTTVTRLPCDSYKEHLLVEEIPTTYNEKAVMGSKGVCSFCGVSAASHNCIYCSKKSCGTCRTIYTKDPCVLSKETHYFVDQQHRKSTSEKQVTASQKQTTLSLKDKMPDPLPHAHVTGENYCDFCGLAANLICRPCLKTICDTCKHIYAQDLCPPTKREHQFENINEQSTNTDDGESKDSRSPWSCGRCTFLNSSSHRICAVCTTSRGVNQVALPKSGTRKCQNCTYANEQGAIVCKMCSRKFGLDKPECYT